MIHCQLRRLLTALFCVCVLLVPSKLVIAEELFSVHLNRVAEGEFPAQHWYPQDRLSIEEELGSMNGLLETLAKLDQPAMREIKQAYADRAVIVRDLGVANLRARIDKVCDTQQPIIDRLKNIRWANASDNPIQFTFIEKRLQVQSIAYLVNLYAARELASGRIESASQTLAGGYAFAHNVMRTTGDINLIMGMLLQSVMSHGIADLQSVGVPDMRLALARLSESQMDQQTLDRLLWQSVCQSMPVLVDRRRKPREWREDISATLKTFHRENLTPESTEGAEQIGRQIQALVQMGKRVKALSVPVKYEHGGLAEVNALKPGQQIHLKVTLNIPLFAEYVEKMLDTNNLDQARSDLQQRLCGMQCVELLRRESAKRGRWLSELDDVFKDAIPVQQSTNKKPTIAIMQSAEKFPSYEIKLPEKGFDSRLTQSSEVSMIVAVSTEQALSK